jgi:hypothetical protein
MALVMVEDDMPYLSTLFTYNIHCFFFQQTNPPPEEKTNHLNKLSNTWSRGYASRGMAADTPSRHS